MREANDQEGDQDHAHDRKQGSSRPGGVRHTLVHHEHSYGDWRLARLAGGAGMRL